MTHETGQAIPPSGAPSSAGSGETAPRAQRNAGEPAALGQHLRRWPRRARRGLVGVMLTVAVVAVVLVILLGIYTSINASMRTQTVQTTVTSLEAETRRSFANAREYTSGAYEDFLALRMPRNAIRGDEGDEEIITPWGGEITAGGGDTPGTGAASPNRFWIRIQDLPRDACVTIAESFLGRSSVVSVHVGKDSGNTTFTEIDEAADDGGRGEIETACDGGDDDQVGIVFRG